MKTSRFLLTSISLLMGVAAQAESIKAKPDLPTSISFYPFGKEELEVPAQQEVADDTSEMGLTLTEDDKELLELDLTDLIIEQEANAPALAEVAAPAADEPAAVQETSVAATEALPMEEQKTDEIASESIALEEEFTPPAVATVQKSALPAIQISLRQVFAGSPVIYTLLFALSVGSLFIWIYNFLSLRSTGIMPDTFTKNLRNKLNSNQFDEALSLCLENNTFFCKMLAAGISMRKHGLPIMLETMKSEGRRATAAYWQRIALINDIAIIAPMLGLLGTVLGMFYAFYDLNRSVESVTTLFDGLGISVGTTVAGLIVAIVAMILNSLTKYRLVRVLSTVENEAQAFAGLLDDKTTIYPR